MFDPTSHQQNSVFASFPSSLQRRLQPSLKVQSFATGKILYESQEQNSYLYFPLGCVVHYLYEVDDGDEIQVACIGQDGACGDTFLLGQQTSPVRAEVSLAGDMVLMPAKEALYWFNNERDFREPLLKSHQKIELQLMQRVACHRFHTIQQQLCFWLLQTSDKHAGSIIDITHEKIATYLGVRREGVSEAAHKLQTQGVIDYRRGHVKILQRPVLERLACDCYRTIKTFSNL